MLKPAILATLSERPSHPYEIWSRLSHRLQGVVDVSRSRVYEACSELARDGLIERIPDAREAADGVRRKPHRLTPRGARALDEWVGQQRSEESPRLHLMIRLLTVPKLSTEAMMGLIEGFERELLAELSLGGLSDGGRADEPATEAQLARHLAAMLEDRLHTALLGFIDDAREDCRRFQARPPGRRRGDDESAVA